MPTLRSDQPPVNAPKTVSTQVNSTRMPARPPSAIGARTPGMTTGAPLPGTPTNPGLSADQPVPSIGATRPMATAQPKPPSKPAKTGLEGLTRQASLQPGRRKQIVDIISKYAEYLPVNCSIMLVEKLIEKHAELALSGVTEAINKAALKKMLKQGSSFYQLKSILNPRVMREFVKRSDNKPKAAQLYVRLVKAATILNSKG